MKTIRQQLLLGLMGATLFCVLGAGATLYRSLLEETNELADLQLRQLAAAMPNEFAPDSAMPAAGDPEEEFVLQAWDEGGAALPVSHGKPELPRYAVQGFSAATVQGRWRSGWRCATRWRQAWPCAPVRRCWCSRCSWGC
jgi:two-component system OmpR family sensor kinase